MRPEIPAPYTAETDLQPDPYQSACREDVNVARRAVVEAMEVAVLRGGRAHRAHAAVVGRAKCAVLLHGFAAAQDARVVAHVVASWELGERRRHRGRD